LVREAKPAKHVFMRKLRPILTVQRKWRIPSEMLKKRKTPQSAVRRTQRILISLLMVFMITAAQAEKDDPIERYMLRFTPVVPSDLGVRGGTIFYSECKAASEPAPRADQSPEETCSHPLHFPVCRASFVLIVASKRCHEIHT
jgi:hypothetical protein